MGSSDEQRDRQTHKKPGAPRKTRKKRSAIPVATPVVPNIPAATNIVPVKLPEAVPHEKPHIDDSPKQMMPPMSLEENIVTTEKQKKKLEKELKSKQKEIAKQEKKEKER